VIDNNPYINFTIKDFPGNQELKENSAADIATIKQCGSLIFVIDAQQQEYEMSCNRLCDLIKTCCSINKNILFEVFIHKVDTGMFLSEDQKMSCLNDIQGIMKQNLNDINLQVSLSFYLTSIYDHTIYEALSKVV
jgi:Ras-related GTP-binding protein C/D